jgi:hypothetical protein
MDDIDVSAVDQSWHPQPDTALTTHTPNNDRSHCLAFVIIDATTTTLGLWQDPIHIAVESIDVGSTLWKY